MKFIIAILVLMTSQFAFADELNAAARERAQLEVLKATIKSELGLVAEVQFANELLSPMASYNGVSDVTQAVANLWRSKQDQVFGAGARQVIVNLGLVGYSCQALVKFKGGLANEDVVYVGLNACSLFFTEAADKQNQSCAAARDSKSRGEYCQPISILPPSALSLEVRR